MRRAAWCGVLVGAVTGAVLVAAAGPASAAAGSLAAGSSAAASCRPQRIDLGDPLGGHASEAYGVSADGALVVGSATRADGREHAMLWRGGVATDLGVVGRYDQSWAYGVNSAGMVVGQLTAGPFTGAAFEILPGGKMRVLPDLDGHGASAVGVTESRVIVGNATDADGRIHAVTWTSNGTVIHDLGIPDGYVGSVARGINAAGVVVGVVDTPGGDERPAVFANGTVTVLAVPGGTGGSAEDVDDSGRIVGYAYPTRGGYPATAWPSATVTGTTIASLPGGNGGYLYSSNNLGQAVGIGDIAKPGNHSPHAIFWPGSGPLLMLRPLTDLVYHDYSIAKAISDSGTAVGASQTTSGDIHGTVWTCAAAQAVTPRPAAAAGAA